MKKYILYHASCADGFGAAFAAWLKFGSDAEYIPVQYGKPMPKIDDGSEVYIVDFSYPTQPLIELWGRSSKLTVLDHHATARTELQSMSVKLPSLIRFDMNKSGAVMAWEYFHPNLPVPEFFLYLQDRDLWQWKLPYSREVSDAIRSYPFSFDVWNSLCGFGASTDSTNPIERLWTEGIGIRRMTKQTVELAAKNARWLRFNFSGNHKEGSIEFVAKPENTLWLTACETMPEPSLIRCDVPALNCTAFISETCEKMLEDCPTTGFVASYFDSKDGKRVWSLRSRKDFDCSWVAKVFGGGGHKQASGFTQDFSANGLPEPSRHDDARKTK